jgi:hypothetical protein
MKLHDGQDVWVRFRVLTQNEVMGDRTSYQLISEGLPSYRILLNNNGSTENVQPEEWPPIKEKNEQSVDKR